MYLLFACVAQSKHLFHDMTYYWLQYSIDTGPNVEEEVTSKNNDNGDIHEDRDGVDLIEDTSKVTSKLCPNLSETITRMMSGVASGVVVKVPGNKDKIYLWSDSIKRDKVMAVLAKPSSSRVWDTLMSKGVPEEIHVVIAQCLLKLLT